MTPASNDRKPPRETVNIRIRAESRILIDCAVSAGGKTRTNFILEAAARAAEDGLLDQAVFSVGEGAYAAFVARLDAPAQPSDRLVRTMQTPLPCAKP